MCPQVLDQITQRLYEQTMDAQDGVLYFLLDQMADQHVKELLLAYVLLLKLGEQAVESQLLSIKSFREASRVVLHINNCLSSLESTNACSQASLSHSSAWTRNASDI